MTTGTQGKKKKSGTSNKKTKIYASFTYEEIDTIGE